MLKAYVRRFKNVLSSHTPSHEWVESAFHEFFPQNGNRRAMYGTLAASTREATSAFARWLEGTDAPDTVARGLLYAAANADDRNTRHASEPFRSYVDISVPVHALRIIVDYLSERSQSTLAVTPLEITSMLLEHDASSRTALLVHADLLLGTGATDAAIESIQRALRVQAVCPTAQKMLFRAYAQKRAEGSTSAEIEAMDYDLSDKFCPLPFTYMSTGFQGETYPCSCPAWVPYSIGNIVEAPSADAIWNSDAAAEIRRSVLDGDFQYCSRTLCSYISSKTLPRRDEVTTPRLRGYIDNHTTRIADTPAWVELNHDPTCNLACPSCRTEIVAASADEVDRYAGATERVILPLLRQVKGHAYITGGGEAFASKHFREILRALNREEYPGLDVYLITNGQLMTPRRWSEFPNLPEIVGTLSVSIDAACAETYEKVRRPGKWAPLMKNLERLATMRRNGELRSLCINFVVQKENFREMLAFVELGDSIGADRVWFQRVVNYGAYDEAAFAELDVSAAGHPDHAELLDILRSPLLRRPLIEMQMLMSLVPELVAEKHIAFLR
jgi:pyruvate-formate lyase-activating enzyme